jgi:hypothetical protein
MLYYIQVYFKGNLLFATDPDTTKCIADLISLFNVLNRKFPDSEGYSLDVCVSVLTFTRRSWQRLIDSENPNDLKTITIIVQKL